MPRRCCGQRDCLESWVSGTGFRHDHESVTCRMLDGATIIAAVRAGDADATATFDLYINRLGRALALIANLVDSHCFALGRGMSNVMEI